MNIVEWFYVVMCVGIAWIVLTEYKRGYARAELDLKREPLSDYATYDMFRASKQAVTASCYWAGIRDAEKAHGITGVDDD